MQSVQKLKEDLQNNLELTGILDVLKGIAMAKFRMLERSKEHYTQFLTTFENFFQMLDFNSDEHPFLKGGGRLGMIIVTSDEGFMGGLNTRVINEAIKFYEPALTELIVIGEWGSRYLQGMGYQFAKFPGITKEKRQEDALKIKEYIFKECLAGKFSRLLIAYPKPVSFTIQTPLVIPVLPCADIFKNKVRSVIPREEMIQEGSTGNILEYLMDIWLTQKLLEVFEDSNLSEFSARAVHLEQSHHLLNEKTRGIRLQYFRSHHELVDKGIREAFSSRVSRRKKVHGAA